MGDGLDGLEDGISIIREDDELSKRAWLPISNWS